jgi:hypothetical protein
MRGREKPVHVVFNILAQPAGASGLWSHHPSKTSERRMPVYSPSCPSPFLCGRSNCLPHRLNMELDLQSLFGLLCTVQLYSLAKTPQLSPSPSFWAHTRGRYWSAKIVDISLLSPGLPPPPTPRSTISRLIYGYFISRRPHDFSPSRCFLHSGPP